MNRLASMLVEERSAAAIARKAEERSSSALRAYAIETAKDANISDREAVAAMLRHPVAVERDICVTREFVTKWCNAMLSEVSE